MKRLFVIGVLIAMQSTLFLIQSNAQMRIGYLSYDAVMRTMPEYRMAQEELSRLRVQYEDETRASEEEFNAKYEDFLDNLSSLATTIRRKRQTELQQLMESNLRFREEAKRLLAQAEDDVMTTVRKTLDQHLATIAKEKGYVIILNTDNNGCPFLDPTIADDITPLVIEKIK